MNRVIFIILVSPILLIWSCNKKETIPPPTIDSFNPTNGGYGTTITITGTGFNSDITQNTVTIGGIHSEIITVTKNSLTVLIPSLLEGNHSIIVSNSGGSDEDGPFIYEYTLYIAGTQINEAGFQVAKYWENGTPFILSDGSSTTTATSIALLENSVYVVGTDYKEPKSIKLWINGVENSIAAPAGSSAFDVLTYGTDVYVAGYITNGSHMIAAYWKNGVVTNLTGGETDANARAIFVSGNDVYVAGFERTATKSVAKYWKNGNAISLTDGQNSASAMDVYLEGSDVYVCGVENINSIETAKMWKNGSLTTLGGGFTRSFTIALAVKGSISHIVGYENNSGMYWKNGISTPFTGSDSGGNPMSVYSIGNDIYMAGYVSDANGTRAAYWKNGDVHYLTDGTSYASASAIVIR